MTKTSSGNFFEDFRLGMELFHPVPRTVTTGDAALYAALYGTRFAIQSSDEFARNCGLPKSPLDTLLLFHVIFGRTVGDISLNAVANLGYAECRWLNACYPGDSFTARSVVIGLRENSGGETGIVYVRSTGYDQRGTPVLSFVRWVMVRKRDFSARTPDTLVPELSPQVSSGELSVPDGLSFSDYNDAQSGSPFLLEDYDVGEKIDHVDGMTIEEAEHQIATRLYQNTARGHFDAVLQHASRYGRRLIYGGHIISVARALSFNGIANGGFVAAINGGRHVNPAFAGDTIYCWSEILDKAACPGRADVGAIRVRTIATKNVSCGDFPSEGSAHKGDGTGIVLDLDYWLLLPTTAARKSERTLSH